MGNIFKVLRRDFLRLFKVPAAWVILFGMVFIPPLYSWYNIVGFWDPYGNTKGITVAIANNDDGTDNALIGKQNLGDQIVKQMRSNDQLGWTFVTEAEAMDQVESGKAYAAIIIPKDFSDDLAGVVTGGKSRPTLEYYVNEKASAIAPKVTDVGASTVDRTVNSTFVSTVSEVLTEVINTVDGKAISTEDTTKAKALTALAESLRRCAAHTQHHRQAHHQTHRHPRADTHRTSGAGRRTHTWHRHCRRSGRRLHPDRHYPDQSERLRHLHVRSA